MKVENITLFLFFALSAFAHAANTTGTASATIIQNLTVANCQPLSFGTISTISSGGTVVISPTNQRSTTGIIQVQPGGFQRGFCDVLGGANRYYSVVVPSSVLFTVQPTNGIVQPGYAKQLEARAFNVWSQNTPLAYRGVLNATGQDSIRIGGTLVVPANAHPGLYQGIVPVTVSY